MNRKDFNMVAACISSAAEEWRGNRANTEQDRTTALWALWDITDRLAHEMQLANPRFDRDRFLAACEMSGAHRLGDRT